MTAWLDLWQRIRAYCFESLGNQVFGGVQLNGRSGTAMRALVLQNIQPLLQSDVSFSRQREVCH